MATTREIRRRIRSIKNTAQITKAMQMVAASKMRKAQQRAIEGRPYHSLFQEIVHSLIPQAGQLIHPLLEARAIQKEIVFVIGTDKGLCGPLNTNLLREIYKHHSPNHLYVSMGKKVRNYLSGLKGSRGENLLLADFELKDNLTFREAKRIGHFLIEKYLHKEIDAISIAYSHFVNPLIQKPIYRRIAPISKVELVKKEKAESPPAESVLPFNFEPSAEELLESLLPFYIHWEIYQAILDNLASEHSARMVAMKSATENAKSLLQDLSLEYNKARQESITKEILEISTAQYAMG
ncbi:ATP synthase F1 subunit gamma [Candidatus Methylacidiphilum infernorum]|uniref:ATP synthase gamma chain n=1 Tax=Methylacidiphilum infernorum (isolate V4) TaxID=481448 RepID=ATPG_METI4|nr:ATP synthase F1 subunit gamma [Candidatus Methylacidiphilum infernorum]B3E0Z9.1 RecName: Full=ATP synthase gamma chain; AltName: Full=ATP synthase F1 sector gamma subunit; AltName: Full=F-ATPase gamma subunit [Methylacidiphilum infernorum V4]ACD84476.1 F0F1-type ATP synthase, gamma subunit [Methylacidiphilum infernorum V4]